jgi:hypothetical protein
VDEARADLAGGRVVSYEWGDSWGSEGGWNWAATTKLQSSGTQGPLFVWRTPDWRVHYANLDGGYEGVTPTGSVDASHYSGPQATSLAEAVRSAGRGTGWGVGPPQPLMGLLMAFLGASILVLVVAGPAPATGTRWYWFWLVTGVPLGLGLLYWLATERPWADRTELPPSAAGSRDPRRRWYRGMAFAILASIACAVLIYGLGRLLGDGIVPHPGG